MTVIAKKYWKWNIENSIESIKLGDSINELLENHLILDKKENSDMYVGKNNTDLSIGEKNGKVDSIFFKETYSDLFMKGIWDTEIRDFTKSLDLILESTDEYETGSKLIVFFRGGFVSFAGITK